MAISYAHHEPHQAFRHFNKYDFVKAFVATSSTSDVKLKEEKEKEAAIIADAIEETQSEIFESMVTKQDLMDVRKDLITLREDLKKDSLIMEHKLIIKLTAVMAALMTFLPLVTEFLKRMLG